jgi:hypothetical protein
MVRTRKRSPHYKRPSRAKARVGWAPVEVAQWCGISRKTLGTYFQRGLVDRPTYAGNATRLDAHRLAQVVVARELVVGKRLSLAAARDQMAALSREAIDALAKRLVAVGTPLGNALGVAPPDPPRPARPIGPPVGAERWDRLMLLPGFEVSLRTDAPDDLRLLVERVRVACAKLLEARASIRVE